MGWSNGNVARNIALWKGIKNESGDKEGVKRRERQSGHTYYGAGNAPKVLNATVMRLPAEL